ncbi:MAG: prolipoprotein diacylglyceryl transferase, partial [Clostridia bacterium]|nr:prolipoprotein diacylglyceryl transferase [Clostridia bacterium]
MFPVIEIFGRTVGTYGLCALAGVAAAFLFLYFRVKKDKAQIEDVILMTLCILAGVLIGGHLLYAVTRWEDFLTVFSGLFQKSFRETALGLAEVFGGSVFYGGLLGSLLSLAI